MDYVRLFDLYTQGDVGWGVARGIDFSAGQRKQLVGASVRPEYEPRFSNTMSALSYTGAENPLCHHECRGFHHDLRAATEVAREILGKRKATGSGQAHSAGGRR